jgi:hypothetical protein
MILNVPYRCNEAGSSLLEWSLELTTSAGETLTESHDIEINCGALTSEYEISFTTFIPGNHALAGVCLAWGQRPIFRGPLYVRFDRPGFDANADTYRTRQAITVIPNETADPDGLEEGSKIEALTHPTQLYAQDALPTIDNADDDTEEGDCHLLHRTVPPVNVEMHIDDPVRLDPDTVSVRLHGQAGTGVGGFGLVCPINWDITVFISTSGETPQVTLIGAHDGFPAYELYVNGHPIYMKQPVGNLLSLCGPLDVTVAQPPVDVE